MPVPDAMKLPALILVLIVAIAACDSTESAQSTATVSEIANVEAAPDDTVDDTRISAPPDDDWNWQLTGRLNTSVDAAIWDVDLFETSPEAIDQLRRNGKYVVCYFSAGTIENWRPDVGNFDGSAIGLPLDDWPGERWLDIRAGSTLELVELRLHRARQSNCDAVEPDNVDGYSNKSGFPLTQSDQLQFNRQVAQAAHDLGLAVGLKNALELADALSTEFDFAVTEQCHEYDECESTSPFTSRGKPVFNAEYPIDHAAGSALGDEYCEEASRLGIHTLILPVELDGSWRISCG